MPRGCAGSRKKTLQRLRSIQLPLLWPALAPVAVLAFLRAFEAFEVPVVLGTPAGVVILINYVYELLKIDTPPQAMVSRWR